MTTQEMPHCFSQSSRVSRASGNVALAHARNHKGYARISCVDRRGGQRGEVSDGRMGRGGGRRCAIVSPDLRAAVRDGWTRWTSREGVSNDAHHGVEHVVGIDEA